MKDINLDGLNNVKANKELIERTVSKVMNNNKSKNYFNIKKSAAIAASLMVIVGAASFYSSHTNGNLAKEVAIKTVLDNNVTQNKTIVAEDTTSNKTVTDKKVTPAKTTTASTVAPAKEVSKNPNVTSSNSPVNTNVTPSKTVTNSNVAPSKPVKSNTAPSSIVVADNKGITIPKVDLNPTNGVHAKMLALVVYNGKVYLQSNTELASTNIKSLLGEKVGRTVNSINEWNVKDKASEELASNIGEQDIYTVKGYDNDFRIMSYSIIEGQEYAQFFDCLNGVTIKTGKDIFGKLNLVNNIESAKFIGFDDWNNGTGNYIDYSDLNLLNEVAIDLNSAVPYNYAKVEKDIDASRNNNEFREFTLKLKDGLELKFTAFKNGYVSYGYSNIYFKVENSVIDKLWK